MDLISLGKTCWSTAEVNCFTDDYGDIIAHVPLKGQAFHVSEYGRDQLSLLTSSKGLKINKGNIKIVQELCKKGLISLKRKNTNEIFIEDISEFQPIEGVLILTESCNLGCSYCYASAGAKKTPPADINMLKSAVDFVLNNAMRTESRFASFRYLGGGEPTVEWALLRKITNYINSESKKKSVRSHIRLITNGTLLSKERVDWIADNIHFVTLSFEVLPELQAQRSYAGGKESHTVLMKTVEALSDRGVQFHVRTTVTAMASSKLEEMVTYLSEKTNTKSVRFEPMSNIGRAIESKSGKPAEEAFITSFKAAHKLGKSLGIDVTSKIFQNIERRNARFCDIEFTVGPNGSVAGCHRYSRPDIQGYDLFEIGKYDGKNFNFDLDKINELRNVNIYSFEDCIKCTAKYNCASGCLSSRVTSGEIQKSGPLCKLTRELLNYSIQEKVRSSYDE